MGSPPGLDGTGRQNDQKTHPEGLADRHRILPPQTSAVTPTIESSGIPSGSLRNPCRSSIRYALSTLRPVDDKGKRKMGRAHLESKYLRIKTIPTGGLRNLKSSIRRGSLCNRAKPLDCGSEANAELPLFRGGVGTVISARRWGPAGPT